MSNLIVLSVFLAAVSAAWVWSRRRRMADHSQQYRPPSGEPPGIDKTQETLPADVAMLTPATPEKGLEPFPLTHASTLPLIENSVPVPLPETPSPEPSQPHTTTENVPALEAQSPWSPVSAPACGSSASGRQSEQPQSTSVATQVFNTGNEVESVPPKASRNEEQAACETTPGSLSEGTGHAKGSANDTVVAVEESVHVDAPSNAVSDTVAAPTPLIGKAEPGFHEISKPALSQTELAPKPPTYHPPTPPASKPKPSGSQERTGRKSGAEPSNDLRLRVQLVFGRDGAVKMLALVPDKREGMPRDVEVTGTQNELHLTELREDCYEPLPLADASNALRQGVEWRGRGDARRWRWVLGGRELYVLAPGDEFGLHGFVSTSRLWLNARHAILATSSLRDRVLAALTNAGCVPAEINDESVPSGWILLRDVTPTRAGPMRDDGDILNVLCPAHEIEPHFVGGIRLERNIWLAGFPPRIRFTGEFGNGFRVLIDGQPAQPATDGAFEAPGWDVEGEHRLWFGDRAETYSLRTMEERWDCWHAHDFGTGAAICGAGTHRTDGAHLYQVRIPAANPLLLGAQPGEIFYCQAGHDVHFEIILAMVPFAPIWALPIDPIHADKRSARLVLLNSMEPVLHGDRANPNKSRDQELRRWIAVINDAGRKRLALATESDDAQNLWRRYCALAKQLWRRMR